MDFSDALRALKNGQTATRRGWNGPGQFVALSPGFEVPSDRIFSEKIRQWVERNGGIGSFQPYLMIRTVQGSFVPWLASQGDLLADDWQVSAQ